MSSRKIQVAAYSDTWPGIFAQERLALYCALDTVIIRLDHIGSTSVPQLMAKPIIDMLMEVSSLVYLDQLQDKFKALGYSAMGEFGMTGRRFYTKGGDQRSHHIHAFVSGDDNLFRHRVFRDYLQAHPVIMQQYGQLKQHQALACKHDSDLYQQGKNSFIQEHQAKAMAWTLITSD